MTKETCRVPEFSHEDECAAQDTETCLEESDTKPFEESAIVRWAYCWFKKGNKWKERTNNIIPKPPSL